MKFVLTYVARDGGSAAEREEAAKRGMQMLSKFTPSVEMREWVDRVDGEGGFAVFEADDSTTLLRDVTIWAPFFKFELFPVVDLGDAVPAQQEAIDFRDSIS